MFVKKVAVIGAGTMGTDIAYSLAVANITVVLRDVDENALQRAERRMQDTIHGAVTKGRMSADDAQGRLAQVRFSSRDEDIADVSLAVEAVPERMALKKTVLKELDQIVPPLAILASNTSALSISEMADVTLRPERVAGMHFFYPAHTMKLVEIIAGNKTDREVLETLSQLSEELRKIPVVVKECPGFVVNRVLTASMAAIMRFKAEYHLRPQDIDNVITHRQLAPLGPFVLADRLGLDVVWDVSQTLEKAYGNRFDPGPELRDLVHQHRLGAKTGQGFYSYQNTSSIDGSEPRPLSADQEEDLIDLFTLAALVEAVRIWEEGIASAQSIDVALRAGAGLPIGPLAMADQLGLDVVYQKIVHLEERWGDGFKPPSSLRDRVEKGQFGRKSGRGYFDY